jgi:ankyrin repeat protein
MKGRRAFMLQVFFIFIFPCCLLNEIDSKLLIAASKGNNQVVETFLLIGADINTKDEFGKTPLIIAAEGGHINIIKTLLSNAAKINERDKNGWTALRAARNKGNTEVIEILKHHGATI